MWERSDAKLARKVVEGTIRIRLRRAGGDQVVERNDSIEGGRIYLAKDGGKMPSSKRSGRNVSSMYSAGRNEVISAISRKLASPSCSENRYPLQAADGLARTPTLSLHLHSPCSSTLSPNLESLSHTSTLVPRSSPTPEPPVFSSSSSFPSTTTTTTATT